MQNLEPLYGRSSLPRSAPPDERRVDIEAHSIFSPFGLAKRVSAIRIDEHFGICYSRLRSGFGDVERDRKLRSARAHGRSAKGRVRWGAHLSAQLFAGQAGLLWDL